MNPQQHLQLEHWHENSITQQLLSWLKQQRQDVIPAKLLTARNTGNRDLLDTFLSDLQATTKLEAAVQSGSFIKDTNKPTTHE